MQRTSLFLVVSGPANGMALSYTDVLAVSHTIRKATDYADTLIATSHEEWKAHNHIYVMEMGALDGIWPDLALENQADYDTSPEVQMAFCKGVDGSWVFVPHLDFPFEDGNPITEGV